MTQEPKPKPKNRLLIIGLVIAGGVIIVVAACCVLSVMMPRLASDPTTVVKLTSIVESTPIADAPTPTEIPGPTDTPQPTAIPTPLSPAPSCSEIAQKRSEMTDAQWKNFKDNELPGLWVIEWNGKIREVGNRSILWGGYPIHVDITSNCGIIYGEPSDDVALSYSKGQELIVTGQVDYLSVFIGSMSFALERGTVKVE